MPAAARVGDSTGHLQAPLGPGPGSRNVLIGGKAAWRAGIDFHACSDTDGPNKKHIGGMVVKGSSTVLINGFPAARKDDNVVEIGSSNSITAGCDRVQIGG
ncbi:PAAR domain-containing protein [Candidatus Nitrospira nitrificans]|uniref:PAAR motif-containing protein n=1 Tax=Candidatus Nitrospira nitrificans TaxID=1742973 RepID=A0A0S4L8J0_9BACT|nr:PAAR domain-containing protein [Candidatus Nitrospira nitrificans]CUS34017.1 PAAR motif-containing protein [Candidatus Nitrospira nitrificans]